MTRPVLLALAAWWLIILTPPQGKAVAPLIATEQECEAGRKWVLEHRSGFDALCLPAGDAGLQLDRRMPR